jgi:hypothetical protein
MFDKRESATSSASPAAVWAVWADVEHWSSWNPGVKWSRLDGPFAEGTKGKLKPAFFGPLSRTAITAYEEGERWVITTFLPGAQFHVEHLLATDAEGRSAITYHGYLSGPLAPVIGVVMGKQLAGVVHAVHDVAEHAERAAG